ncbi:hypothetical protein ES703_72054 [subsurface metagenome]
MIRVSEGSGGTTADNAILGAATAGKHRRNRILCPVLKRRIAGEVAVSNHRAHNVGIMVFHHTVEVSRNMRERIFPCLTLTIPPNQIGHGSRFLPVSYTIH